MKKRLTSCIAKFLCYSKTWRWFICIWYPFTETVNLRSLSKRRRTLWSWEKRNLLREIVETLREAKTQQTVCNIPKREGISWQLGSSKKTGRPQQTMYQVPWDGWHRQALPHLLHILCLCKCQFLFLIFVLS